MIGYTPIIIPDIIITTVKAAVVNFELQQTSLELQSVTIKADYFQKDPNIAGSITSFSYEEIRRAPGGFEDVVRSLSSLPGIAQADAGRNDLVVRGGAPSENLYIVDGIKIPNINHFGSQGSTGGPLSYIDLNLVKDVSFSTGGFPAIYGDKLSSVLKINLNDGKRERPGGKATISATQFGINAEGPIGRNVNFLLSARRSYLDLIFRAAGFGFVPEYYDVLNKISYDAGNNNTLSFLFIGAFDNIRYFNSTPDQRYQNSRTLGNDQTQYVSALSFRHLFDKGFYNLSVNRNYVKYEFSQKDTLQNPIFLNNSLEEENNFQAEAVIKPTSNTEINSGIEVKLIEFRTDVRLPYFRTSFGDVLSVNSLKGSEKYRKVGFYTHYNNRLNEWAGINLGVRMDYFSGIQDPLTFSPRLSLSLFANEVTTLSFSTGVYYQSPSYIWLIGDRQNRDLKSIRSTHFVAGIERRLREDTQVRIEGFYKIYSDYPASSLRPYLVMSNTGAGFGGSDDNFSAFALERLVSEGRGNVRGIEFQVQKKSSSIPCYGLLSLTYSEAYFTALDGIERPGSYDQRFIFNLSGGYMLDSRWEFGIKFRLATGKPYTPFNGDGSQDAGSLNSARLATLHSLDIRVDRRWTFEGWTLITYIDVQNVYNRKNITSIRWDPAKNMAENSSSLGILPSIGISAEL